MTQRLLIVDDDPQMVRTLCDILALHGWDAEGVTDGHQALAAVEREAFAAVLMDVRMPGLNGVETFRAMQARRPGIRVILMTAFAAHDLLSEAERQGVLHIFPKPVDVRSVVALIRKTTGGILVVDNDADHLRTLTDVLEHHGFSVTWASGVDEALDRLGEAPPAVVVLNLTLAAGDPPDALRAIHRASPGVLFVLYGEQTAMLDRTVNAVPAGWVRACLRKPFDVQDLLQALE